MKNLHEAGRWLKQANDDLQVAKWNAEGKFWAQSCFMAQQAGEKALKAFCYANGERNIIGHSLLVLIRKCEKYNKHFADLIADCKRLDKYYILTRYPNGLPDLTPAEYFENDEATKAIKHAARILKLVRENLKLV